MRVIGEWQESGKGLKFPAGEGYPQVSNRIEAISKEISVSITAMDES